MHLVTMVACHTEGTQSFTPDWLGLASQLNHGLMLGSSERDAETRICVQVIKKVLPGETSEGWGRQDGGGEVAGQGSNSGKVSLSLIPQGRSGA